MSGFQVPLCIEYHPPTHKTCDCGEAFLEFATSLDNLSSTKKKNEALRKGTLHTLLHAPTSNAKVSVLSSQSARLSMAGYADEDLT